MEQRPNLYQTVIYDAASGDIIAIHPNLYISSKRALAQAAARQDWHGISFMYFPFDLDLDPINHRVRRLSPNTPPSLVSATGVPIDFELIIHDRRRVLESGVNCLVEFEGGAGDQLMEAAAVLTAMATYPGSTFSIRAEAKYLELLHHVQGLCQVQPAYVGQARQAFDYTVSNHTQYISDPRGGYYGKASLYGAWLGLDRVNLVPKIKLKKTDYQAQSSFLESLPLKNPQLNFLCQFRSGSGHAKSWQHEHVLRLADLLHQTFDSNFFVVGGPNELPAGAPGIIDLTGETTWWQTCLLESLVDLIICIDSGVMHFARSLAKPYIALWGGTNAQVILGADEQPHDIRLDLECKDLICYDCQNKTNACMYKITPDIVLERILLLLKQLGVTT